MNTFTPQLSQQDLAEMIDREGLAFERRSEAITEWRPPVDLYQENKNASWYVGGGWEIRLAPGALTEFGLKPGMVPHNPDGLPADQITEGGKYRAWSEEERNHAHAHGVRIQEMERHRRGAWEKSILGGFWGDEIGWTYRVPVNTPFPKPSRTEPPAEQSSVTQQAGQSLTPRTDAIKPTGPWHEFKVEDYEKLARTLETELTAALAEKQDFLDTLIAIYDKLGIKEGDVPGGEKVSVTVLRHVTAALAQRDEANRLLGEATEALIWAMGMEPSPCRCLDCATPPHVCKGHKTLDAITNHLKP